MRSRSINRSKRARTRAAQKRRRVSEEVHSLECGESNPQRMRCQSLTFDPEAHPEFGNTLEITPLTSGNSDTRAEGEGLSSIISSNIASDDASNTDVYAAEPKNLNDLNGFDQDLLECPHATTLNISIPDNLHPRILDSTGVTDPDGFLPKGVHSFANETLTLLQSSTANILEQTEILPTLAPDDLDYLLQ